MSYSLSELEALGKKAARGAGFSWGEAEETGQALRILAASGLPAAAYFAQYLKAGLAEAATCPIKLGCALVDRADPDVSGCTAPALLMPFVARLAARNNTALSLVGAGFAASAGPDLAIVIETPTAADTALSVQPAHRAPTLTRLYRAEAELRDLATLNSFARRTYAPETEARRAAGAGAGDDGNT